MEKEPFRGVNFSLVGVVMSHTFRMLLTAAVFSGITGCGEWGGGAALVPRVTILPPDFGAASDSAGNDAAETISAVDVADGGFGTLEGQVLLTGAVPTLAPLIAKGADVKDKEVCAAVDVPDERIVVGAENGLANVFVFLQRAPPGGKPLPSEGEDVIFDQENCRFLPHCLVIPAGRTVRVLSNDPIAHNTHTYPSKNDAVNSGVPPMDRVGVLNFVYRRSEAVPLSVTCDYHTWMRAYHLPVDHPYAAVTDADGRFSIPELPAGSHAFAVWHESVDGNFIERRLNVNIRPGVPTEVRVEVPVTRLSL